MTDRTATDEAIDLILNHDWQPEYGCRHRDHFRRYGWDGACLVCRGDVGAMLALLPAGLLLRLAAQKNGGEPLTVDDLMDRAYERNLPVHEGACREWMHTFGLLGVVVYPAPETTT
jgi:hypothetical protein